MTPSVPARRVTALWLAALLPLLAIGCRTLPATGVQSFSESTSLLTTTLGTAGTTAVSDVAQIYEPGNATSQTSAAELSTTLKQAWDKRIKLMTAMNRYAASLQALVDAGQSGQANAEAFRESVKGLVEAAGNASFPGAGTAGDLILNAGTRTYGEIAKAIAANQIHKAVDLADPLVESSSKLIVKDLDSLRSIAVESHALAISSVERRRIFVEIKALNNARNAAATDAFGNPPSVNTAALQRLASINEQYAQLPNNVEYQSYVRDRERAERLFATQTALLDQAMLTTQAWANGHHDLTLALREKRAPSLAELARLTQDLYTLYKNYQDARIKP